MKTSMEALIHHFKLYTEGFHVPAGEVYAAVERRRANSASIWWADGTNRPYRAKIRAPVICTCSRWTTSARGHQLADVSAIIGTMDVVFGEIDGDRRTQRHGHGLCGAAVPERPSLCCGRPSASSPFSYSWASDAASSAQRPTCFVRIHSGQPGWAKGQISKYPAGRQASAVIPLLWRAQEQEGWLSRPRSNTSPTCLAWPISGAGSGDLLLHVPAATCWLFGCAYPDLWHHHSCMICGAEELIAVCKELIAKQRIR